MKIWGPANSTSEGTVVEGPASLSMLLMMDSQIRENWAAVYQAPTERILHTILVSIVVICLAVSAWGQPGKSASWEERAMLPSRDLIWGSIVVTDDDSCCEEAKLLALESGADAALIESLRERAYRYGPVLWLKLEGNHSLKIVDPRPSNDPLCLPANVCRRHYLAAWWPTHQYYVVDVGLYEGRMTYLVSARDGRTSKVFAPPVLSPNGRYAVAWDPSPAYGNGLQLIDLSGKTPRMFDITTSPSCPGTKKQLGIRPTAVWLDETRLKFEGKPLFDSDDPDAKQIIQVVDGKPEWVC